SVSPVLDLFSFFFFFFSSRRRHTRSKRDWSSDVCSSDLSTAPTWLCSSPRRTPAGRSSPSAPPRPRWTPPGSERDRTAQHLGDSLDWGRPAAIEGVHL